jgi:hypothetical protein
LRHDPLREQCAAIVRAAAIAPEPVASLGLGALQRFILDHLADPEAVLVLDETAELKQGQMTVGVARQHARIPDDVEFATKTEQGTEMVTAAIGGELHGHAPLRAEGDRGVPGPHGSGPLLGDTVMRERRSYALNKRRAQFFCGK